jgi:DNA-binding NarL/FixJ family response regulator
MIEAGAQGYLLKNVARDELLTAIRRVCSGKSHYSSEIADVLVRDNTPGKTNTHVLPSLSGREKQIVRLIMEECTSAQIAEKLNISFNTVETHRRNIMHKLNTKNTAGIVRTVMEHGLLGDTDT